MNINRGKEVQHTIAGMRWFKGAVIRSTDHLRIMAHGGYHSTRRGVYFPGFMQTWVKDRKVLRSIESTATKIILKQTAVGQTRVPRI